ncbi:alanine dehydrogenase [Pontibacterium granulatum]|uniref:alanine dehydrogenase n=1 Tax=Pontibacterium granulatum TaxID=2036029 RepID=UPI00249B0C5E|nr:alanine dehydrogenase [Pontibacterium granulatum]MDI3324605.1 alanine dehydrogenase [Pontibacterium granulatum]
MLIGVPKEIKVHEYRVGLTPMGVHELVSQGHQVLVESFAGMGVGYLDEDYTNAGASVTGSAEELYLNAEMIIKVKEPQPRECKLLSEGQTLFAYLHLAADRQQTDALIKSGCTAIAFETVTSPGGGLPLLAPMSEVAGRMSIQAGAHCLEKAQSGKGVLLGGVPGVPPAKVLVIGGGVVGENAARMALGLGAQVTIVDRSVPRLQQLDAQFGGRLQTLYSTQNNIEAAVLSADLIVGAVLIPGAAAPKLVTRDMVERMKPGTVMVDVAIDQGGCFETSRPTTHQNPIYEVNHVVHYCVANMPGAVARTSTLALQNVTLPYAQALASKGWMNAMWDDPHLANGLNIQRGQVACPGVADAFGMPLIPMEKILSNHKA